MYLWVHKLGSPRYFYAFARIVTPWLALFCAGTMIWGVYQALWVAPPDYQQGESYRIMYVHVPAAWMSMFIYIVMAFASAISLIWHIKLADWAARMSAPIGASFTFLALATGSLWGKPMWGAWWVWDARLTSELVLLFLYLGYMALHEAYDNERTGAKAAAILALVGVVNIPIIHYSVEWWHTLHQGASVTATGKPAMPSSMLVPLLVMSLSFKAFYGIVLMWGLQAKVLEREYRSKWVRELLLGSKS